MNFKEDDRRGLRDLIFDYKQLLEGTLSKSPQLTRLEEFKTKQNLEAAEKWIERLGRK